MSLTRFEKIRRQVERKLNSIRGWELPWVLGSEIDEFEDGWIRNGSDKHYASFLDTVRSLDELRFGLRQLMPLVEDAMAVAEGMDETDFADFKICLAHERLLVNGQIEGSSKLPKRFIPLVLPVAFVRAAPVAERFAAPLGTTLVRMIQEGFDITHSGFGIRR